MDARDVAAGSPGFAEETQVARRPIVAALAAIALVGLVALALALRAAPATAAFPGQNGPIAFQSNRDGNQEIYVMDANGQNQTNVTNNAASDAEPAFSPDGTKIAFNSNRDGSNQIYVMGANGQNPTNLTNNMALSDRSPAFSPDGTTIAFERFPSDIFVMDADDGGNQTNLSGGPFDFFPVFSSDGTKIAFGSSFNIWVMDADDGGNRTSLTNTGPGVFNSAPDFSPDGTKIVFDSTRDGNQEIYVMDADGQNQTRLTDNPASDRNAVFSPDGTKIAFDSNRDGDREIYVMDADDGGNQIQVTSNTTTSDGVPDWGVAPNQPPTASAGPDQTVAGQAGVTQPQSVDQVGGSVVGGFEAGKPSNDFRFGKLKRNLDKGTARLEVIVPGPGELRLQAKRLKGLQQSAESAGTITLRLKTKYAGYARRRLERRAELLVEPKVTFVPNGGDALRKTKPVRLRMRP